MIPDPSFQVQYLVVQHVFEVRSSMENITSIFCVYVREVISLLTNYIKCVLSFFFTVWESAADYTFLYNGLLQKHILCGILFFSLLPTAEIFHCMAIQWHRRFCVMKGRYE